jgi:small subunit ribosomal protein S8
MSMTDPIADLLTRIRNASKAKQTAADVPASRMKKEIVRILKEHKYVKITWRFPTPGRGYCGSI